ncbi:MAG: CHASE4 domain-containing protein [Rariglobus sp.]
MSIKLRFALLLGLLLFIFLGSLGVLRYLEKQQLTEALASSQLDATSMLERWLDLNGSSLRQFSEDYSKWDEMVSFVKKPDEAWAEVNVRQSMDNFNLHAVWVLSTEGAVIYTSHREPSEPSPLNPAEWLQLLGDNPFPHFFAPHGHDLIEIRAAPIQPSGDSDRKTPPQGWLVSARIWDQPLLKALGNLTESTISLGHPGSATESESTALNGKLTIMRPLNDWRGRTLELLHVTRETPAIAQRLRTDVFEARVFIIFGLLVMGALGLSLHNWVLQPLNAIGDSLAKQDASPLQPLIAQNTELSRIASQLEVSFEQQKELLREVEERARLGRDLHDGVIQSIYAAGMGLAATRTLIQRDPEEAARGIDQVRSALNETIRDVRNFITGLEPEALHSRTFTAAVASLFDFFKTSGPPPHRLDIDESSADRLHLAARTAALQIIRECVSNAFRHGRARCVEVDLHATADRKAVLLTISDDGCGFDLASVRRGHGLDNVYERARTLGATAEIISEIGKGTRTTVLFPVNDLPA